MYVVLPRQFSFHILTIKTPKMSDPNVYPGPIIATSLLIKKTRLGVDRAQPLGVVSGTGYPSGFGADGSAEEEFLSTPTTALVAFGCSPPSGSI